MIAVADNGASKCEWMIGDGVNDPVRVVHPGFNPNSAALLQEKEFVKNITNNVDRTPGKLFFYSAGMGNEPAKTKMHSILKERFPTADISIETDLTGTGRAIFGDQHGVAAILGTGANAGYYDGKAIKHQPLSLGFLLGDEGSGAYLGKVLMQHYLRGDLPTDILRLIDDKHLAPRTELLKSVYSNPSPHVFTAMLRAFEPVKGHPFLSDIIRKGFKLFFEHMVARVEHHGVRTIGFTGSVAYHFSKELALVSSEKGFRVSRIIQHPAKELFDYHLNASGH